MGQRPARRFGPHRSAASRGARAVALLVDTGPLYAALDRGDRHHNECLRLLSTHRGPLLVPVLVITEVVHFLATRLGAEAETRFLGDFALGVLMAEPVRTSDWLPIGELVWRYRDVGLGAVDASIVVAASRLDILEIATLDHRHFSVVRRADGRPFQLRP